MNNELISDIIDGIFYVMPVFNKELNKLSANILKGSEIFRAHIRVLFALNNHGRLTVTDLAKKLSVPKSNVTNWIDKLVKCNIVERIFDDRDRRLVYLQLTDKGSEFYIDYMANLKNSFGHELWKFTDEDLKLFKDALDNMQRLLEKINNTDY